MGEGVGFKATPVFRNRSCPEWNYSNVGNANWKQNVFDVSK